MLECERTPNITRGRTKLKKELPFYFLFFNYIMLTRKVQGEKICKIKEGEEGMKKKKISQKELTSFLCRDL